MKSAMKRCSTITARIKHFIRPLAQGDGQDGQIPPRSGHRKGDDHPVCQARLCCYVFVGLWTVSSLSVLSLPISIHFPYHTQITSDCLVPFTYLPITPISDPPLSYPVALCLSAYQWLFSYLPVRYNDSQSGGTVGLGLCPLRLVTLLARVPQQYIRMYS